MVTNAQDQYCTQIMTKTKRKIVITITKNMITRRLNKMVVAVGWYLRVDTSTNKFWYNI